MDYWSVHPGFVGFLLLFAFAFFPRVTMLFTIASSFGWGGWITWLFLPSVFIAVHAMEVYGSTNWFLIFLAWLWVFVKAILFLARATSKN